MKFNQLVKNIKAGCKQYAPEILLGAGIASNVASMGATIYATKKISKMNKEYQMAVEAKTDIDMSTEEIKSIMRPMMVKHYAKVAGVAMIPIGLFAAGTVCHVNSYRVMKNRNTALQTALLSATAAYANLLARVQHGAKNDLTAQEVLDGVVVKTTVDENGNVIKEKVVEPLQPGTEIYVFKYDKYCESWEPTKDQNLMTLKSVGRWANDRLILQGYVFLNDVLERLGMPKTIYGQTVGWSKNGDGDGFICLGDMDLSEVEGPGYEDNAWILNFNCDGYIVDQLFDNSLQACLGNDLQDIIKANQK